MSTIPMHSRRSRRSLRRRISWCFPANTKPSRGGCRLGENSPRKIRASSYAPSRRSDSMGRSARSRPPTSCRWRSAASWRYAATTPSEEGEYDTPPIAPAMWHSYHLGGEYAAVAMMAAINFRELSGEGQFIDVSVHEAVNTCTEIAIPTYIYNGQVVKRQTARHAAPSITHARLTQERRWRVHAREPEPLRARAARAGAARR